MEGMRDGFAGDTCFVCGLLWPYRRPCPRCRGGMRWVPARWLDEQSALLAVGRALDTWRSLGDRASLEALLECVHGGEWFTVEALEDLGSSLDELRRAYAEVAPEHAP